MNKDEVRGQMRRMRRALSAEAQREAEEAVFARVSALNAYRRARTVMAYAAARGELPLGRVFADVLAAGKTLVLPRCAGEGVMHGYRVDTPDRLVKGAYGILEPGADCPRVEPEEIDLILVPGTAFDVRGHRIGQGGGYYDRYLNRTRAVRVGVCHDFALLSAVPSEAHDARMDIVVTPGRTVIIREETT